MQGRIDRLREPTTTRPPLVNPYRLAHRSTSNHSREHAYHSSGSKSKNRNWDYVNVRIIGKGTFGVVCYGTLQQTGYQIAIKKVLQDNNYKNRYLDIIKDLDHPNIVKLLHHHFTKEQKDYEEGRKEDIYLHLLMEYVPEDLSRMTRHFHKSERHGFPNVLIKVYGFQLLRAIAYLRDCGICHRDIKPRNILINPKTQEVKICDFGSAKRLVKGYQSLAYVCSRYYRAPELAFGSTGYSCAIDVWSVGCVIAETFLGEPLFFSESSLDHLVSIISVLGTPTKEDLIAMNPQIKESPIRLPNLHPRKWSKILPRADPLLIDLLSKLLVYNPIKRLEPFTAMAHPYFEELKTCKINGYHLPFLLQFSESNPMAYVDYRVLHRECIRELLSPTHS